MAAAVARASDSMDAPVVIENPMKAPKELEPVAPLGYTLLPPRIFALVFFGMCVACFMAGLDITIVVTALPKIGKMLPVFSPVAALLSFTSPHSCTRSKGIFGTLHDCECCGCRRRGARVLRDRK